MDTYYLSKLDMILKGLLESHQSENYKNPDDIDILGNLLQQNHQNITQTIDLLYAQIDERHSLKHKSLKSLEDQIMKVQETLPLATGGYHGNPFLKASLEKTWIDLEKEKLKEEIGCFKDVSYLNTKLVYFIGKYKEEKGKHDLMTKE